MNKSFKFTGGLVVAAASLLAAHSAQAAIDVTFDVADSNIGAGIYAFDLSGVMVPPTPTYQSEFDLTELANPAPGGVHNTMIPVGINGEPTGWNFYQSTESEVQWYFDNTSGAVNGTFVIDASANLSGTLDWQLAVPGITADNASGTVTIAVPEPGQYGLGAGLAAFGLIVVTGLTRSRRTTVLA